MTVGVGRLDDKLKFFSTIPYGWVSVKAKQEKKANGGGRTLLMISAAAAALHRLHWRIEAAVYVFYLHLLDHVG